jgi:hypothetical protein
MPQINIDKNVYLLGAGFSKEIGIPLQDEFLLVAQEVFFKDTNLYRHFENVFNYKNKLTIMKNYLNYPLLNLEQLFNLIEMDIFYSNKSKLKNIKNDFIKLICDVIIDKTPNPFSHDSEGHLQINDDYSQYLSFIRLFIKDVRPKLSLYDDTIISFNYDLVLEGTVSIFNWRQNNMRRNMMGDNKNIIGLNTLFGKPNIVNDQLSNYFMINRPNSYFPNTNIFSNGNNSIKLIKLHGSINWKDAHNNKTFVVPPTWNKSDPRIRKLWDTAYHELINAKRIIVIGYSFPETDIYVKSLLALALNENKILQSIYFINPDKDITKKICLSLPDRFFEKHCDYKEWKFSEFIGKTEGREFIAEKLNRLV